jgi:D-alanine-D-alanine ligase
MKNVAIICGGDSGEFEISVKSAQVVKNNLSPELYDSKIIVVSKKGWYGLLKDGTRVEVDKNDFSIQVHGHKMKFDVAFNAVHGEPGENGPLSGYLELLGIPCTSSPLTTCALTFHKDFCKRLVSSYGVNVAPSILINKGEKYNADEIIKELGLPMFVKPTCNGSSVGVTKVKTAEELAPAVYTARVAGGGGQVMCEKFVDGREFGCGAMNYQGKLMVFPLTEICSKNEFFDYEAKYTAGKCDEVTPAQVDEDTEIEIKATTAMLYEKLECKGFVRMDYIVSDEGVFFIEANIVPGMSVASIIPAQARCFGLTLEKLFGMAIEEALNH